VGKTGKDAEAHFTWFTHFTSLDCPPPGTKTRQTLGWQPARPGLPDDLAAGFYF